MIFKVKLKKKPKTVDFSFTDRMFFLKYLSKFLNFQNIPNDLKVMKSRSLCTLKVCIFYSVVTTPVSNQTFPVSFFSFLLYLKYAHSPDAWSVSLVAEL